MVSRLQRRGKKKQTKPQRARTTPQLGTVSMDPYLTNKNRNNTGVKGNVLGNRQEDQELKVLFSFIENVGD